MDTVEAHVLQRLQGRAVDPESLGDAGQFNFARPIMAGIHW